MSSVIIYSLLLIALSLSLVRHAKTVEEFITVSKAYNTVPIACEETKDSEPCKELLEVR